MKRVIVILLTCLLISCVSKLSTIEGTWEYDEQANSKNNEFSKLGVALFLGGRLQFKDGKCIVTMLGMTKVGLDVEEGKNNLYIKYEGSSFVINIVDNNTIEIELYGNVVRYKRV